jgi:hypothetical protein
LIIVIYDKASDFGCEVWACACIVRTIQDKGNADHLLEVLGLVFIWSTPRRSPRVAASQRRSNDEDEVPQMIMSLSTVELVGAVVLQRKRYSLCIMAFGEVNGV